jgi:hypothetical protein
MRARSAGGTLTPDTTRALKHLTQTRRCLTRAEHAHTRAIRDALTAGASLAQVAKAAHLSRSGVVYIRDRAETKAL